MTISILKILTVSLAAKTINTPGQPEASRHSQPSVKRERKGETHFKMGTFSHNTYLIARLFLEAFTDLKTTPLSA